MGRNIFNQPPREDETPPAPGHSRAASAAKLPGAVGGLRDSLREITANSIRDIAPDRIETDGLRDRLALEDSNMEALVESIRAHGQHVPIMVRPSERPDHYRIIYGRRRLAAIRKLGGTVKAIVRTLDDDASLIAQGQENTLRLDPSFIEKALFISEMQAAQYKPAVIQDALGLTRQGVSNHRVIVDQLPLDLIRLIGPAHGVGRRQWGALAKLATRLDVMDMARAALADSPEALPSDDRFKVVLAAAQAAVRTAPAKSARGGHVDFTHSDGQSLGALVYDDRAVALKIARTDHPEFSRWVERNAKSVLVDAFERWRSESES